MKYFFFSFQCRNEIDGLDTQAQWSASAHQSPRPYPSPSIGVRARLENTNMLGILFLFILRYHLVIRNHILRDLVALYGFMNLLS